jgi:hypothetical protein
VVRVKKCTTVLVVLFALVALTLGCKPKEATTSQAPPKSLPDSGQMGATAGRVKDQAVQAVGKVNQTRDKENAAAAENE